MPAIVQINFDYDSSAAELLIETSAVATKFLQLNGLLWKVWLGNDENKTTGGIYLFESREKAEQYLQSELVAGLRKSRANVEIKIFDVLAEPSTITHAPIN